MKSNSDNGTSVPGLSPQDLNTDINHEPRIRDVRLAAALDLARPSNIRRVIEKNRSELERYGTLHAASATLPMPNGAKKQTAEYWLNVGQAVLVSMLSRTPKSADVREDVIRIYLAWKGCGPAPFAQPGLFSPDQMPPDVIPLDPRLSIRRGQPVLVRGTGTVEPAWLWSDWHPGEDMIPRARIMGRDAEILGLLPGRNLDDEAAQILRKSNPDRDPEPQYQGVPVPDWLRPTGRRGK